MDNIVPNEDGNVNEIQLFNFNGSEIKAIFKDGEPWFIAKYVCEVLSIVKYRDALARLDEDERGLVKLDTLGGMQDFAAVNESGLYSLIMGSNKPEAKAFKKWVTSEVLPQIRKTGSYNANKTFDPASLTRLDILTMAIESEKKVIELQKENKLLEQTIIETKPKADALDAISQSDGEYCLRDAAKILGMRPREFTNYLYVNGYIFRSESKWIPYQNKINSGMLKLRYKEDLTGTLRPQALVTDKCVTTIKRSLK